MNTFMSDIEIAIAARPPGRYPAIPIPETGIRTVIIHADRTAKAEFYLDGRPHMTYHFGRLDLIVARLSRR